MSLNFNQFTTLNNELTRLQSLVTQVQSMCNSLKDAGTTLYNDANLLVQFPNDGPGTKTWMATTNTQLTNFLAALTAMPIPNS